MVDLLIFTLLGSCSSPLKMSIARGTTRTCLPCRRGCAPPPPESAIVQADILREIASASVVEGVGNTERPVIPIPPPSPNMRQSAGCQSEAALAGSTKAASILYSPPPLPPVMSLIPPQPDPPAVLRMAKRAVCQTQACCPI